MSRQVIFTIKGDSEAVSTFVNDRLVKPSLAAASAERAELDTSNAMNALRHEHESAMADLQDEKQELAAELDLVRDKLEKQYLKSMELQEAALKWQQCAAALQIHLGTQNKSDKPNKELKDRIFAMIDLLGNRDKVHAIKALREITGCNLNEGKIIVDKVFDNYNQVEARVIPLPPSTSKQSDDES